MGSPGWWRSSEVVEEDIRKLIRKNTTRNEKTWKLLIQAHQPNPRTKMRERILRKGN